jgi:hypothetical protein
MKVRYHAIACNDHLLNLAQIRNGGTEGPGSQERAFRPCLRPSGGVLSTKLSARASGQGFITRIPEGCVTSGNGFKRSHMR